MDKTDTDPRHKQHQKKLYNCAAALRSGEHGHHRATHRSPPRRGHRQLANHLTQVAGGLRDCREIRDQQPVVVLLCVRLGVHRVRSHGRQGSRHCMVGWACERYAGFRPSWNLSGNLENQSLEGGDINYWSVAVKHDSSPLCLHAGIMFCAFQCRMLQWVGWANFGHKRKELKSSHIVK